jgi:outer membrane protein W
MKKLLFSLAMAGGLTALAQPIELGLNFTTGLPMGATFSAGAGVGLGATAEFNVYLTPQFSLGLESGFLTFLPKTTGVSIPGFAELETESTYNIVPVVLKGDYYFLTGDARPYAGVAAGYYLVSNTTTSTTNLLGVPATVTSVGLADGFGVRPEVGLLYVMSTKWALNLSVGYSLLFNGQEFESIDPNTFQPITEKTDPTNFLSINLGIRVKFDTYEAGGFLRDYF